jgi:hypothetical protein
MFEGCRQDIPGAQHPASMAAETAQSKGRLATEVIRNVESACYEQIGARAAANDVPDSKSLSPAGLGYGPERDRPAVEFRFHCRASQTKLFICIKAQRRARNRYLEACGVLVVPKESVSKTERKRIHRPRRRYTYRPVAEPAGKILDTRLGAGLDHVEGTRMVFKSDCFGAGVLPTLARRSAG